MKSKQNNNVRNKDSAKRLQGYFHWPNVILAMLLLLVAGSLCSGQVSTTLIQDTVYHADGTLASGTLLITWPAFTTAAGAAIPAGNVMAPIGSNGSVSLNLTPNIGAMPAGTYYTAVYHLDDGTVSKEYWVVPAVAQTTITAMRSEVVPASVAVQMASETYINNLIGQYLPLKGGTLQGSLLLNADPQMALQAATKEYVDTNVQGMSALVTDKVATSPSGTQVVAQPGTSTLAVNNLNGAYIANQYGTTTGIANAVAAGCTGNGCNVHVEPGYGNTEVPSGYQGGAKGFTWPRQTLVRDERNGVLHLGFRDPISNEPSQQAGESITADFDLSPLTIQGYGNVGAGTSLAINANFYTGLDNTQNSFSGIPMILYGGFHVGLWNAVNAWDSGQKFGQWNVTNCYGAGDCIGQFNQIVADGGINRRDDEGVHEADISVTEDPNVFTGTISGTVATGAATILTSCTYGCATQGQDRLLIDTNSAKELHGTFQVGTISVNNQMPPGVIDPSANYPVSTFALLCYAGSDNGAGGASGCAAGSAPSGYIPPSPSSPSLEAPVSSIVTSVVASYAGIPAGVCTSANLQSANPAAACYMAASGVGCLSDLEEYETVNYTYNSSAQTITLSNLRFPHVNGMAFATGGLCGYAVEVAADVFGTAPGGNGVQSQVFPVEGSMNATTLYYIPQRTNEGYGLPELGLSSDRTSSGSGQLSFSTAISGVTILPDGKTVQFNLATPPGVSGIPTVYNALPVAISTSNSTFNGTYPITFVGTTFVSNIEYAQYTYVPSAALTGTIPATGSVSYSNLQYTLYPAARTNSVYDTANNSVDGTFYVMPNTVAWATGDTVRQPHYQQMNVSAVGGATQATQYMPTQSLGGFLDGVSYYGLLSGWEGPGYDVINGTSANMYSGLGGTHSYPGAAYSAEGVWLWDYNVKNAAPTIVNVAGCQQVVGCSSVLSNFNLFALPPLPNMAGPGDRLNYDPNYKAGNNAGGLYAGKFTFSQNVGQPGGSLDTVEVGYGMVDRLLTAPVATIGNISTSESISTVSGPQANVMGATGSTAYKYYGVAHTYGGGTTQISSLGGENSPAYCGSGCGVNNGNAVLSATNYNQICVTGPNNPVSNMPPVTSYDVLKLVGSTYYLVGSVASGCVNDEGQTLSVYTLPTANTSAATAVNGALTVSGTVNAAGGYQVNGAALAASHLSNGTTGSGAVVLGTSPTISGTVNTPIVTGTQAVTFQALPAAGSGATTPVCLTGAHCTVLGGIVSFTTGTSTGAGEVWTLTATTPQANNLMCEFTPGNPMGYVGIYTYLASSNTVAGMGVNTALGASSTYNFVYHCWN